MGATETTEYLIQGDGDQAAYEKFVARETRKVERLMAKGHRDFAHIPAGGARAFAESFCSFYRHQFRTLIPADPKTRKPL